jgi:hypothetical protein
MALFSGSRAQQPNRLGPVQIATSEYGVAVAIGWGSFKAPIKLLDLQDFTSYPQEGGGKGGDVSSYEYYGAVDALVTKGPIAGFGNVYSDGGGGNLLAITDVWTVGTGGLTYQVEQGVAAFYYDEGVTYNVTYSVAANDFGSDGSITLAGTQPAPFEKVSNITPPGPGQYNVSTTGLYAFNAADTGKVVSITYTYTTADTSNDAVTVENDPRSPILTYGIAAALGTTPQAAWGYMQTAHPANALRYDGLARMLCQTMYLGTSGTVPSLSIEVLNGRLCSFGNGVSDCDPSVMVTDMLSDAVYGAAWPFLGDLTVYSNFCVANNLFMSLFVDSARKITELIQEICDLTNSAPVWSGATLKIVPYGDTTAVGNGRTFTPPTEPVYEIDEDEMLCGDGEEPVKLGQQDLADNYNRVQFEYSARNDNYNTALIHEQDEASILMNGLLPMKTVSAHHFCVQFYAAIAMNMLLRRNATPLRLFEFTLPWYYCLLEPMDINLLNLAIGALGSTAIRVVSVEEQEDYSLKFEVEDFLWGTAAGVVYPKGVANGTKPGNPNQPGATSLQCAYVPSARVTGGDFELWLALSGGPNWGGCDIFLSLDDTTYTKIGTQFGPCRAGSLTAALAATADPDTTDTASVTVTGTLATVTAIQANAFASISLLGSELIAYETATLTGSTAITNSYNLTTLLRRGIFSTAVQAHAIGEQFIRLDDSIFKYVLDPTLAGKTVWLKFTSFNLFRQAEQPITIVTAYPIFLGPNTSTNMVVGSYDNGGGTSTVIVDDGGVPGLAGTATLINGAVIALPAQTWPTEVPATWYGVNYNPAAAAYVIYTDPTLWAADAATMVKIGQTTTPASGGGAVHPSSYSDTGTYSTTNPAGPYAGGSSFVSSQVVIGGLRFSSGICRWAGFAGTTAATKTLSVTAAFSVSGSGSSANTLSYTLDGVTWADWISSSSVSIASATYTVSVPSGTNLASVSIRATSLSDTPAPETATITVSAISIA